MNESVLMKFVLTPGLATRHSILDKMKDGQNT